MPRTEAQKTADAIHHLEERGYIVIDIGGPVRRAVVNAVAEETERVKKQAKRDEPDTLRLGAARMVLGIGESTFWRWMKERPGFPQGRLISPRLRVWSRMEMEAWMQGQQK